ncbi:MAG: hypothetical protein PHT69_15180 [Bacteroidales bacterium]|nr:hypothetical protein [Bacteroidales bacterium]
MKKISILLITLFVITGFYLPAQSVLMYEDVSADTIVPKRGANRLHFTHWYFNFGVFADKAEKGAETKYVSTNHLDMGLRYKLRVCNFYAIGTDLSVSTYNFRLKQNGDKTLPDTVINDKEKYNLSLMTLGFYNRFNFGKRGNMIGKFLDIGVHGQWHMGLSHYTKNEMPNGNIVQVTTSKLKYYEQFGWGLHARLGVNRWVLSASYRMSDLFKPQDNLPELPRLSLGIQVGLH